MIYCESEVNNFLVTKEDKQRWWDEEVIDADKEFIKSLPYFDANNLRNVLRLELNLNKNFRKGECNRQYFVSKK